MHDNETKDTALANALKQIEDKKYETENIKRRLKDIIFRELKTTQLCAVIAHVNKKAELYTKNRVHILIFNGKLIETRA